MEHAAGQVAVTGTPRRRAVRSETRAAGRVSAMRRWAGAAETDVAVGAAPAAALSVDGAGVVDCVAWVVWVAAGDVSVAGAGSAAGPGSVGGGVDWPETVCASKIWLSCAPVP